jgi:hypothetical protein
VGICVTPLRLRGNEKRGTLRVENVPRLCRPAVKPL